jgi:hypothetical protein
MILLILSVSCIIFFLIGYFAPFQLQKIRRSKKVTNSDLQYYLFDSDGVKYAFTYEQLEVAKTRAQKLNIK